MRLKKPTARDAGLQRALKDLLFVGAYRTLSMAFGGDMNFEGDL